MSRRSSETSVTRLRHQAEVALRQSRGRKEVESLLSKLVTAAEEGTEPWLFAHRHLAELKLESSPWNAALHLRKLVGYQDDDVIHALMGLCHALLGNYRAAVNAYRRALTLSPRNPWYHHNLGHLLDVALGRPEAAESHLRLAHEMEAEEDEITASLAHCLARLDRFAEAQELAGEAVKLAPKNSDHRALLRWVEESAQVVRTSAEGPSRVAPRRRIRESRKPRRRTEGRLDAHGQAVLRAIEEGMRQAGFSATHLDRARAMWTDYRRDRQDRLVKKPAVFAAAVEYAIALVHGMDGITQAAIARRYGVAPTSLASRYGEIRDALELRPGDPRYGAIV